MQLSRIKISNILSFPYVDDVKSFEGIYFDDEISHDINVLVGPNGSGKSNLLEVINQVFKVGIYKDFVLQDNNLNYRIIERTHRNYHLRKHFDYQNKDSQVVLRLHISEGDYVNIERIFSYREFFEWMIEQYSDLHILFPTLNISEDDFSFRRFEYLDIGFEMDDTKVVGDGSLPNTKKIGQWGNIGGFLKITKYSYENTDEVYNAWIFYLQYFELFQLCLVIWNHANVDVKNKMKVLGKYVVSPSLGSFSLHDNFAALGPSREFDDEFMDAKIGTFSLSYLDDIIYAQDTKRLSQPPIGYFLCKKKLLEHHKAQSHDITLAVLKGEALHEGGVEERINYYNNFYEMLRHYISSYTGYDMVSFVQDGKIVLFFVDQRDNFYRINELSSGEQSFLYIIFTLFGYGLENGVFLLDEPELHLHPQKQKDMLRMLQELAHQYHIQIMMSTHSPLMITEDTISHVYRLHRKGRGTFVHNSGYHFSPHESNLIQMLKFGYIAKIFFVQKVIMVEGDTDEYFFDYYLRYLRYQQGWSQIHDFAVINVNGKGGYKAWNTFLTKFGIESYFIGDWDNIIDTGFPIDFSYWRKMQKDDFLAHNDKISSDGHKRHRKRSYGYLITFIKSHDPELYSSIEKHIDSLYKDNVFILHHGDLEWYLGLRIKGLDETVLFCHTQFDDWLSDDRFDEERSELEGLFLKIFG